MNSPRGQYQRTHVYDQVDYERPKYLFEVTADRIISSLGDNQAPRCIDVGGASGAFSHYLSKRLPDAQIHCLDYDQQLVDIGREKLPHIHFRQGDANRLDHYATDSFDVVSMLGTLSVFDDFRPALGECLRLVRPGGLVIIVGQFNEHPVDALIQYRYSGESGWNSGYNLFSRQTVSTYLDQYRGVSSYRFTPFELPFDLEPQDDPIRSWTETRTDGHRRLVNGLNLIIDLQTLEIFHV